MEKEVSSCANNKTKSVFKGTHQLFPSSCIDQQLHMLGWLWCSHLDMTLARG